MDENWAIADTWDRPTTSARVCPNCGAVIAFDYLRVHDEFHYRNQMRDDLDD